MARKVEYLSKGPNTTGDGDIRWVGFKATSITGEEKEFWWWTNAADSIDDLRTLCGSLLAERLIEAQIGPGVDLSKSSQQTGKVTLVEKHKGKPVYGIYVESKHRPMFNFMISLHGLKRKATVPEGWSD